jgi:manganese efflux pump family protein
MPLVEIVVIAVGLAMDAFAVSLAAGAGRHVRHLRPALRLAFHLGLFQFLMPIVGWYLGATLAPAVAAFDHWVAFTLLCFVGGKMMCGSLSRGDAPSTADPSRGITLVSLSVATSIDALAVGISLAVLDVSIWYPSAVIGVITACLSALGIALGSRAGARLGRRTELIGGVLLVLIGLRILAEHLAAG